MLLTSLQLQNFKSHLDFEAAFGRGINCITGLNGAGKTNLLDAIHYLALTKSAFLASDGQNIHHQGSYFLIRGVFEPKITVTCYLEKGKKKILKVDDQEVKTTDHIGKIPMILTTPYDTGLLRDGSEVRRKFVDGTLAQIDPAYLVGLLTYQRILRQRNSLLKAKNGLALSMEEKKLLEIYDQQIIDHSRYISEKRSTFLEVFSALFQDSYQQIATTGEAVRIQFRSMVLQEDFEQLFALGLQKDLVTQRTNLGSHKDDFDFTLNNGSIKKVGSQGQQKTFFLALRLAQYDYLKKHIEHKPILMLDDLFDKLDENRTRKLLAILEDQDRFGQVFITDTRSEQIRSWLQDHRADHFIEIKQPTSPG